MTADQRRARNRRRWQRRRRRQVVALLLLLPLLVGAAILSTNVVKVLGSARALKLPADVLARPRTVPAKDGTAIEHLHEKLPVLFPVPDTADLSGKPTLRVTEPLPQRFYQPGSHISRQVKWKLAQLKAASRAPGVQPIAMVHRSVAPEPLNALEAVFQPGFGNLASYDDPLQRFWDFETLVVELLPGEPGGQPLGGTPIPEPGTGVLVSVGLLMVAARRRRRA